ncbi:MAG: polyprenyl synthetase family protein [candidate division Zixibacteria bacterium]|nr:polyprenyl synthetase family protein [candidate division Zixibacteria bacterium]
MTPVRSVDGWAYLESTRQLTDNLLARYAPSVEAEPRSLHEAMRYSLMAGGKRLRPILCLAAFEYCGGKPREKDDPVHLAMAALEMVHTYSLIHDDLPCMDDDDLRRGLPTVHKKFGEALAVLAGDALHVVAFELMARTNSIPAVAELSAAVGTSGMLGGQVADLEAEGRRVTEAEISNIHARKTGALIRGSVRIGAILAGADQKMLARLTSYGEKIGLAFQIVDDVLDIEGDARILGKEIGSDSKNQKATYPAAVGLETAKARAGGLIDEALALFEPYDDNVLTYIARYIGQREN